MYIEMTLATNFGQDQTADSINMTFNPGLQCIHRNLRTDNTEKIDSFFMFFDILYYYFINEGFFYQYLSYI